jgi:single-strand DNA-binding protein
MAICRFSIAVNRRKRTADNRWEDEANFFDCTMFGKSAESINQYLEKGRQVSIIGELRQSRWEQDGQSRSRVEIAVNSLQLLSSPGSTEGRSEKSYGEQNVARNQGSYSPRPKCQAGISSHDGYLRSRAF